MLIKPKTPEYQILVIKKQHEQNQIRSKKKIGIDKGVNKQTQTRIKWETNQTQKCEEQKPVTKKGNAQIGLKTNKSNLNQRSGKETQAKSNQKGSRSNPKRRRTDTKHKENAQIKLKSNKPRLNRCKGKQTKVKSK